MMNGLIFVMCWSAATRAARAEAEVECLRSAEERRIRRSEWDSDQWAMYNSYYCRADDDRMSTTEVAVLSLVAVIAVLAIIVCAVITYPGWSWTHDRSNGTDVLYARRTTERLEQITSQAEQYIDTVAVEHEAALMVDAMVPGKSYIMEDIYIDGVPEYCFQEVDHEGEFYRDWAHQDIMCAAYLGEAARTAYDSSEPTDEPLRVTGAVLEWRDYALLSSRLRARYWLIDQNGDGTWDWTARYRGTDRDSEFVFLSADGSAPKFDGAEAVELPADWSGTTADVEKIFKLSRSLDNLLCN